MTWLGHYVDDVYRIQTVFNVYRIEFVPVANEDYLAPYNRPRIRLNPELMRAIKGHLILRRIQNEMDDVEPGQLKRYGLYRQKGHTRRRCLTLHASSSNQIGENN